MKKTLLAIALATAATTAQADVSLSGHVNYSMGDFEEFNGTASTADPEDNPYDKDQGFNVVNNDSSGSRFRIVGSIEHNGLTYGVRQELGLANGGGSPTGRISQITVSGGFGQFSLGQGWESGDDITELDYSGTYIAGSGAGGYTFGGGDGTQTPNIDGGRDQRLRYDSPKIGGFLNIAADYDEGENFGVSLLAKGDFWQAGVYTELMDEDDTDELGGSVAVKFSGFTASLQYGTKDNGTNNGDSEYTGVILGYNVGKVSVAIHTENRVDTDGSGDDTVDNTSNGVSFAYRPTAGVEFFAGYRTAESDIGNKYQGGTEDSASGLAIGGIVTF